MGKVLFLLEPNFNSTAEQKLNGKLIQDAFDTEFSSYDKVDEVTAKIEAGEIELIVAYLHELSSESKKGFLQILNHDHQTAFLLCGSHEELHKYYERVDANIVKYLQLPVTINDFIQVVNEELAKIRGVEIKSEDEKKKEETVDPRRHILIVDDDPVSLRTFAYILKDDYVTSVVKSGAQALEFLGKETPDLILLDYEMPVMNGVQTFDAILSEENLKDIPVIFLTGISDAGCVTEALKKKPAGYVLKSEKEEIIKSKIKDVLERIDNNKKYNTPRTDY
ncbi:MAG: response regulator [Treponema sp.]|nr:response regulator [Treponema sp.]